MAMDKIEHLTEETLDAAWFQLLTAFVGINQWQYVIAGACPASIVLRRACRLRSAIYPNREAQAASRPEVRV